MRRHSFIHPLVEKGLTHVLCGALLVSQFQLMPLLVLAALSLGSSEAQADRLGTTTLSAGSAPPPAATTVDSFQPDLFTGRASTSIPIAVPPGRKGMQPSLVLSYSSSARNGWVGVGWTLDVGFIERSTRNGPPKYDSSDMFTFQMQGVSSELVRLPDGTYRAEDEGQFLFIQFLGNDLGWRVRDKSGTIYRFGETKHARLEVGSDVLRWCLENVEDPSGNTIQMEYSGTGDPVLQYILYTGFQGQGEANKVEFVVEDRPDVEFSYRSKSKVETAKRLARIQSWAHVDSRRTLVNRYDLSYRQSKRTGRSLLTAIRQTGADEETSLPPVTFAYTEDADLQHCHAQPRHRQSGLERAHGGVGRAARGVSVRPSCDVPLFGGSLRQPNHR